MVKAIINYPPSPMTYQKRLHINRQKIGGGALGLLRYLKFPQEIRFSMEDRYPTVCQHPLSMDVPLEAQKSAIFKSSSSNLFIFLLSPNKKTKRVCPPVVKRGNGKATISRFFPIISSFRSGICQAVIFDYRRVSHPKRDPKPQVLPQRKTP